MSLKIRERLVRDQEVGGSNPLAPISLNSFAATGFWIGLSQFLPVSHSTAAPIYAAINGHARRRHCSAQGAGLERIVKLDFRFCSESP